MLSLGTPDEEQRENFEKALELGMRVLERKLGIASTDTVISCFGLTVLAVRQAVAFKALVDMGLQDQSVTIMRSLYETLINLTEVVFVNKYKGVAAELTPAEVDAERVRRGRLFVESQRAVNKRTMNALKAKALELRAAIKNKKKKKEVQAWYEPAATSMEAMVAAWSSKIDAQFKSYTNADGENKATPYWNGKGPTDGAMDSDIDLPHLYQWCCNFSHSNFYAVRVNLTRTGDGRFIQHGSCGGQFEHKLIWFATWCLINCLHICYNALDVFSDAERAEIEELNQAFRHAPAISKSRVPEM